jgi:hypothetical protein
MNLNGTSLSNTQTTIIDMERYNGRINILDPMDPNLRFKMQEKIANRNKATEYRDSLNGLTESSPLSDLYFSEQNIRALQEGLRVGVYEMSNRQFNIPPQNLDQLKIIMRSIYLQYATHSERESITSQVDRLNKLVLDYAVKFVYKEAIGYLKYCQDQSTLVVPLDRPALVDRDFKPLEWKTWI